MTVFEVNEKKMKAAEIERFMLILFCSFIALPLLLILKSHDDNSFTSWRWVFSGLSILNIYVYHLAGVISAFFLARLPISERSNCLFLVFFSFLCIVPLWSQPESIIDASRYFIQAKSLSEFGLEYFLRQWGNEINAWTDMPLIPLLYGLIFRLFGEVRIYIQIFTTLLFSLTVLLNYLTARILWDEETGFYSGLLLAGMPYLLMQVPLLLVDVPAMFFLSLSIYIFLKGIKDGGIIWISLSSVSIVTAIFSKYSIFPMLFVMPLISFVFLLENRSKVLIRTAAIFISASLISGPVFFSMRHVFMPQIDLLRAYQLERLGIWKESFVSTFFFQINLFLTIFAAYAVYAAVKAKDRKFFIPFFFVLFITALQVKRIRYIIPILPLFAVMAAYGIHALKNRAVRRLISFCIVISSLVIAYGAYLPFLKSTSMANLKNAGSYLNILDGDAVLVSAIPQTESSGNTFAAIPIVDYFTEKRIFSDQDWSMNSEGEDVTGSALRFTHEIRKPLFYKVSAANKVCQRLVISSHEITDISLEPVGSVLEYPQELKHFYESDDVFKFRTFVTVYRSIYCP